MGRILAAAYLSGVLACDEPAPPEPFDLRPVDIAAAVMVGPTSSASESSEGESPAYRAIPVENGAVVRGRVRFRGRRPYPAPLPVLRGHATCGTFKGAAPFRVDRTHRTLGDAVVWLSGLREGRAVATEVDDVVLQRCEFQPLVVVTTVGSSVRITSHDDTIHALTARWDREAPSTWFQHPFPVPRSTSTWEVSVAGMAVVHCRAGHPWERLEVHAFPHPYATVTDVSGTFELSDVPPGRYELRAYHYGFPTEASSSGRPSLGEPLVARQAVSVEAGGDVEVDIDLSLPPDVVLAPARARR